MSPIILRNLSYSTESQTLAQRDRTITIEHYNPILTEEEKIEQRQTIEEGLFDIFEKYEAIHNN